MKNLHRLKSLFALAAVFIVTISPSAYSQTSVDVPGTRPPCSGDCSGGLPGGGVSPPGGNIGYTPPTGTYSDGYNDGTTGKGMENSRQPGCQREGLFMAEVASYALAGNPPGIVKMTSFGDPAYSDPGWVKMEVDRIFSEWRVGMPVALEFKVRVHYMYNKDTGVANQFKLKNSFAYGCQGYQKTSSS